MGIEEHVLKRVVVGLAGWVRHYREIPSWRKRSYLKRFPQRYLKLLPYLTVSKVCFTVDCAAETLRIVRPELVVVDDKLAQELIVDTRIVLESSAVREKHLHTLIMLADNLANYARTLLRENPAKALEKLRRLEK